jgi:hypothetical protein
VGAEGVYIARAILDYVEPDTVQTRKMQAKIKHEESSIKVYPNPTGDEVYIDFAGIGKDKTMTFQLFDLTGKIIINRNIITTEEPLKIDLTNVAAGYYLMILNDNEHSLYKNKLVIIK